MESFLSRPKRKPEPLGAGGDGDDDEPTEVKLALLSSLHPAVDQETLLDLLLAHDGSVSRASDALRCARPGGPRSGGGGVAGVGSQQSLRQYAVPSGAASSASSASLAGKRRKLKPKRGSTLHLYDPADVAEHTPCTIIHNFLPAHDANELLRELLREAETFEKTAFKLFDNVVSSPHTSGFFVENYEAMRQQKADYYYNGSKLTDVRCITPQLARVKPAVEEAVNREVRHRIATRYPGGKKLRFQSPRPWVPNSAFVNCYNGGQESVGWHSDQLTYLGPRAVIGSVSLGVAREFRVRRVLPRGGGGGGGRRGQDGGKGEEEGAQEGPLDADADVDAEGQISIHLPHNSLLVMHAEMQEEWKHCVAPAPSIDPHPVAGTRRINITYRDYRQRFHPRHTPRCRCGVPSVLRVVQRKRDNYGRYFWMCHAGNVPGKDGCAFFQWAEFDDDGDPVIDTGGEGR